MNLRMPDGMTLARLQDRRELRKTFDRLREDIDVHNEFDGINRFTRQAMEMVTQRPRALNAFDLDSGRSTCPRIVRSYSIGQGCLLARRLVEAGVTFVTVLSGGDWDTHTNNFAVMKDNCLPRVDQAIAALVTDLYARGLDKRVMIVAYGEFGRTPQINKDGGRDHWPACQLRAVFWRRFEGGTGDRRDGCTCCIPDYPTIFAGRYPFNGVPLPQRQHSACISGSESAATHACSAPRATRSRR
jgi:hypothetical protein